MRLSPKEIDFKWLLESIMPTFEPQIKQKNLSLSYDIAAGLPLLYADEDKIKQVLINLFSNAIKFTHKGGITVSARISDRGISPGEEPIFAEICVEDTGIGIKEEDVGKIFDKFVQVDLTTVRQYEGTGLGLSIARGLVSLHKGVIWVTSKYGEGSKFCFTIPIQERNSRKACTAGCRAANGRRTCRVFWGACRNLAQGAGICRETDPVLGICPLRTAKLPCIRKQGKPVLVNPRNPLCRDEACSIS